MLVLRWSEGGSERVLPLAGSEVRLGRGVDNEVVLPGPSVSRHHARLERAGEGWVVEDAGSTNGVLVNGAPVRRQALATGDVLTLGAYQLTLEERREPGDAAPTAGLAATATLVRPLADFAASYGLGAPASGDKRQLLEAAYDNRIFGYLTRLAGLLLTADTVDEVLERVTDIAFEALPVDRGFILLLDEAGEPVCELARLGAEVRHRPSGDVPVSRTMLRQVIEGRVALVTLDAQADDRLRGGESILLHQIRSAMCAPLWSDDRIIGVLQVDSPHRAGSVTERDLDFLTALANYAAVAVERLRYAGRLAREARLRERLERYHSPAVIEAVVGREEGEGPGEEPRRLEPALATVLFADLADFTAFAETAAPEAVAELLSGFFDIAVEAIFAAGGTLDKFMGDCVMAFFGAPVAREDHAAGGVEAAIAIQQGLARWNQERAAADPPPPPLAARIAVNSGPVVVGDVGSSRRVDYSVLGNAVNVAARLEQFVAAPGDVVVGAETARQLHGAVPLEFLGNFQLKGLQQRVAAYRVERRW
jgi:adenylate cyclase